MKKVILSMMITVGMLMFTSCNNTNADAATSEKDTVETVSEEAVLEEVVEPCDTTEAVTRGATASEGFGRCSKCACKKFEGRGDVCKNCGHAYKKHY
ncbi:MAG: hypothetical protein NC453_15530 [Muribaculum sp.]|nr:hypothetical protein [Muribaculum sp.]